MKELKDVHESVWSREAEIPEFPQLDHDMNVDVLVIGGGISGILCAYMLERAGIDCVLVEAKRIGHGVTKNTTAKITVQHGFIYHKIIEEYGVEAADLYYRANAEALEVYKDMCSRTACDFQEKDSCIYTLDQPKKAEAEMKALEILGIRAQYLQDTELPFVVAGAVQISGQAQFHPLKFLAAIAGNLHIYENTMVQNIHGTDVITEYGTIRAKKIIVATHFPFINRHGSYFLKMYQHRSYVIAYENAQKLKGMYSDDAAEGMSFRCYDDQLLIGGGGHRTGKNGGDWREIRKFAAHHYPDAKETAVWSTQDCMTLDGIPYIGRYSRLTPDLYVTAGFSKWGMTSSMAAAMMLRDEITGVRNPYLDIFSPSRNMFQKQLAVNLMESAVGFLAPRVPRCPHLGCALKWNPTEHSWDCPCHGSTFDGQGNWIYNPTKKDLKVSNGKKDHKNRKKDD